MNIEFGDKTVIVTGAAHGFGRAIALAFAQRGANVWACDKLADELAETAPPGVPGRWRVQRARGRRHRPRGHLYVCGRGGSPQSITEG